MKRNHNKEGWGRRQENLVSSDLLGREEDGDHGNQEAPRELLQGGGGGVLKAAGTATNMDGAVSLILDKWLWVAGRHPNGSVHEGSGVRGDWRSRPGRKGERARPSYMLGC